MELPFYPQQKPGPKKIKKGYLTYYLINCYKCREEFECRQDRYKNKGNYNFCSRECATDYKRNPNYEYRDGRAYAYINCDSCGKELQRRADQLNLRGTGNYCKPCSNNRNKELMKGNTRNPKRGGFKNCKECNKEFYVTPGRLNTRKFCSAKCMHKWQTDNMDKTNFIATTPKGAESGKYKHGKRVGKHVNKPKLRAEIIERDGGNWCLLCGLPGPGLHLHRVIYGAQGGKYLKENCVLLCGQHHGLVHTSKKKWQQPLLNYLGDQGTINALRDFFGDQIQQQRVESGKWSLESI